MKKHILHLFYVLFSVSFPVYITAKTVSFQIQAAQIEPDTSMVAITEVLVEENRLKTTYAEQNRNIRIIDRELITSLPATSINEVLGHVSGVDLRQRGPFGAQADVSVDGGTFEQTLILVNGVKMLDAQTAHHGLNIPVPLEAVERIEIIRGPAARIYGINSLTGAINIVTRKPGASGFQLRAATGSSFKTDPDSPQKALYHGRDIQVTGDLVTRKAGAHTLAVNHSSGNGHRYNTAFRQNRIFYNGVIPIRKSSSFSPMGGYVSSDFGANGFYAAPGDAEAQEIVGTGFASLTYQARLSSNFTISPRISYRSTNDDYRYFRHDLSRARSEHRGYSLTPEIHATWQTRLGDIGLGAEWRKEHINSSNIGRHDRDNYGAYAEFKTHLQDWITVNAGTYFNYHTDYGWQIFPGIDIGLKLNQHLKLTAHSGTGQRIPSFTDLYLDQRPGNIGNPLVRPEEAWHIESGLKYTGNRFFVQAHYFYRSISDFIDWVHPSHEGPPYQPHNFDNNQVHGISASGDIWLSADPLQNPQWRVNIQYTYLSPSYTSVFADDYRSKYSIESLRQQITGQVHFHRNHFTALLAGRYQQRISYKSYLLTDLRVARQFGKLGIFADLQNLFDVSYIEAAAAPMPGRWYSLGIKFGI